MTMAPYTKQQWKRSIIIAAVHIHLTAVVAFQNPIRSLRSGPNYCNDKSLFRPNPNNNKNNNNRCWRSRPNFAVPMADPSKSKSKQPTLLEEAAALKAQAERIRLEAQKQDTALSLTKIKALESKLGDAKWLENNRDTEGDLIIQLNALQDRLQQNELQTRASSVSTSTSTSISLNEKDDSTTTITTTNTINNNEQETKGKFRVPLSGFEQEEVDLYLPVALQIEQNMTNATTNEKLEAFHASEELKDHFASKIQALFLGPIHDLQQLEYLKEEFMSSTSSVEKEQLKREMANIESGMDDHPFLVSDTIYRELPPCTEEYVQERIDAISALPPLLQAMYKRRSSLPYDADLRMAIQLDHYEPQVQLLEQVPNLVPLSEESRTDALKAYASLPLNVQDHFANGIGVEDARDETAVVAKLTQSDSVEWQGNNPLINAASEIVNARGSDFDDIEVVDRSRWIFELIPASQRLDMYRPTNEDMDTLYKKVFGRKSFQPSSKPQRVGGGYYVRGVNKFDGADSNDKTMDAIREKMKETGLDERLQIFYLLDPSPATDEEIETGDDLRPLLYVTANDPQQIFNPNRPITKGIISASSFVSVAIFALGACGMNDALIGQMQAAIDSGSTDFSMVTLPATQIALSLLGIQVAHEIAHRYIAWRDKFQVGLPNLIPSLQLGLTGAITPFTTPVKNYKSLFDFSIAGPLAGMSVSLVLLLTGLALTASTDLTQQGQLPVLPIQLLQSSTLIKSMIDATLGNGAMLTPTLELSMLPLHPFAIAGVAGTFSNALALLPIGHTDGGRISMSMCGRRGAYLVKTFTTLLLVAMGLFGLDDSRIILFYVFFAAIWQGELDAPVFNEVDEMDITRGLAAIATILLVCVTLVPVL